MSYQPSQQERVEDAKPYILPAICGVIVLGIVGWVIWYKFGSRKADPAKPAAVAVSPDNAAKTGDKRTLAADVEALETAYQRAVETGAASTALDSLLTRAIDRQREFLKLETQGNAAATERLARFETLRGDLRARTATEESRALEKAAEEDTANGRTAAALQKLREALRLQHEANANAKNQELVDVAREVRLTNLVEGATADPLRTTIANARARAKSALDAQDWSAALKAFEEARAAQLELNTKTPANRSANLSALEQLDSEIESLRAADVAAKITATEQAGIAAETAGKPAEAAAHFASATQQQEELNTKFPKSRFASTEKVTQFAIRRETVLSAEQVARASALDREIAALLRNRQTAPASAKVTEAAALLARVASEFPRSRGLDPVMRRRLEFLDLRRADLESLQGQVYEALAPIPGAKNTRMLRTEVPQVLYTRVMNINPSRNQGRRLPVDSVSWSDAREFCERLSWLLGTTVRLPREEEFRSAWNGGLTGKEWSAENSVGRSREIGRTPALATGFQDVAGNLAEWLELPKDEGGTMPVAGGSFLDSAKTLAQLPIVLLEKQARPRHVGFRFVIENAAGKN